MRIIFISIFTFLLFSFNVSGKVRIVSGKVIDESFMVIPQAIIYGSDTLLLGITDFNGEFKIKIPIGTKSLRIGGVGYEWTLVNLTDSCNELEVILMNNASYDFMSLKKVDRLRMKQFKKLPKLHLEAYQKGIFTTDKPCYQRNFISSYNIFRLIKHSHKSEKA